MKKSFHITYFLEDKKIPTLTGITIEAHDMSQAIFFLRLHYRIEVSKIKYIIEL